MKATPSSCLFALAAFALGAHAQEPSHAANGVSPPLVRFRVALRQARHVPTVRLSAAYKFAVEEILKPDPKGILKPDAEGFLTLSLYQGCDADDRGRDSMERLEAFFGVSSRSTTREGERMFIQNTNVVALTIFDSVWLFQQKGEGAAAIGVTRARAWRSKGIIERFGAADRSQLIRSETNRT